MAGQTCDLGSCSHTGALKLTVKSDYAARAILELAACVGDGRAHKAEELAATMGTSSNYLVQILIELKSAGLVQSVRGKQGGYLLGKPAREISLGAVLRAVEGKVFDTPALEDKDCPPELRCAWNEVRSGADKAADAVTFDQLLEARGSNQEMYYI